ncbi:MAG: amino acid adenylation domain-containing protein [Chloroflexi bacterium]|nr:amino acid adenylation domain-containing protein [Chloroflexota bacterium]
MKLTDLLNQLIQQKITLRAEGEQLHVQAPKGALTPALRELIARHKADLLTWLKRSEYGALQALPPLEPKPTEDDQPFPLTDIQHAYWLGQVVGLALKNGYHVYQEIDAWQLDVARLQQAWQRLVDYHGMLRAVVLPSGQQKILRQTPDYVIEVLDLTALAEEEQQTILSQIRAEMSYQLFDLAQWPLFDIRVTQLDAQRARIHISSALIMLDGGSFLSLLRNWNVLYVDPTQPLPPLTLSYRDYVLWTVALETTPQYQQARDYWQKRLDTLPPAPLLPVRRGAASQVEHQVFVHRVLQVEAAQWQRLKQQTQQADLTPTTFLAALFAEVLTTWSTQPQFTLNCTFVNRPAQIHPQINDILGDFTTITLLGIDNRNTDSLLVRARRIHNQLWQDLEYQTFSGVRVIQEMVSKQKDRTMPLMPVVFTSLLGVQLAKDESQEMRMMGGQKGYRTIQTPQVLLDVQLFEEGDLLSIVWSSVDSYFPEGLIQAMFDAYGRLLRQAVEDESSWNAVNQPLLPPAQLAQQIEVNATLGTYPTATLQALFREQVTKRGDAAAVISHQRTLSYQELYQRANAVAHWLCQQNEGKPLPADTLVAIVMEKGWEQIVGVFGILMAGAAYVPIDAKLPASRRNYLLEQADAKLMLTQSKFMENLTCPPATQGLAVDTQVVAADLPALADHNTPNDLAYVLYTSGSTGDPKGVMIEQRSVVNRMVDIAERFGLTPTDRVLALTALHHDLSVFDIFGMLAIVGGAVVLPAAEQMHDPKHWAELMAQAQVTLWNSVPAFMQLFVDQLEYATAGATARPNRPLALRWVILAGDFIPVTLPDRLRALLPEVTMIASGGPTETTVWDIYYPIGAVDPSWASIPYGKPLKNAHYYVLNENLQPCPTWVSGELYIGGAGLARGYWQDAEKTQAKFITHPQTGQRLYRSGDVGRRLPDGNIEILGRTDFQIKIAGHRIELGEIEAHLLQHPLVKAAVVNLVQDANERRQLAAYVVLHPVAENFQPAGVQGTEATPIEHLREVTLHDPVERLAFKLRQPGIRQPAHPHGQTSTVVDLPKLPMDETDQARFLARQSYRTFSQAAIPLQKFSEFLRCLMQIQWPDAPLPKYAYPSAGGLYPIQCYLYLKADRIEALAAGFYYYHPVQHQLVLLSTDDGWMAHFYPGANQAIFDQAGFAIFLVAAEEAIRPLYGELTRDFCLLEAGYISQLLMMEAPTYDLGLCPVGAADQGDLRAAFL